MNLDEIPSTWTTATIGDLVESKVSQDGPADSTFRYIDIGSVDNVSKRIVDPKTLAVAEAPSRARQRVQVGDVLVSMTRPNLNAVARVGSEHDGSVASTGFDVLRPKGQFSDWLFAIVRSHNFVRDMTELVQGALYPAIRPTDVRNYPIALPPEAEQRRIVAKLDALQSRTRLAREALAAIPALLGHYRQSVLAAAVTGSLSSEYREDRGPVVDWQGQIDQYTAGRKRARTNSKDTAPTSEIEQDLPPGWILTTFDAVCDEITVGHVGPMTHAYVNNGVPFLRSQNVRPLRFDRTGLIFVSRSFHAEHPKSRLRPGDLVVVRSGNAGQATVVPDNVAEANCADLVIARPSLLLNPWYAAIVINSPIWQSHVRGEQVGIAQAHFNVGSMRTTPIGLPPREEQDFIVTKVMRLLGEIASIGQKTDAMINGVNHLDQSLLTTAFRGDLVPQDPTDELASALLAKLMAARSNTETKRAHRRPQTPGKRPIMSTASKDSVKTAILQLKTDHFSFDELRSLVPGDYESLKTALFDLLQEPSPIVRQIFDKKAKAMQLVRVRP